MKSGAYCLCLIIISISFDKIKHIFSKKWRQIARFTQKYNIWTTPPRRSPYVVKICMYIFYTDMSQPLCLHNFLATAAPPGKLAECVSQGVLLKNPSKYGFTYTSAAAPTAVIRIRTTKPSSLSFFSLFCAHPARISQTGR